MGCSPPSDDVPETPPVEIAAALDAPKPAAYYEFLWCEFGEKYSVVNRDAYFADFNAIVESITERGLAALATLLGTGNRKILMFCG